MALVWILTVTLYITHSAEAVDVSEASFVSAKSGEDATLHCKFLEKSPKSIWFWYKQRAGQEPQEVAVKLPNKKPTSPDRFKISDSFSLTIEQTTKDDEGMYFCGEGGKHTITFSKGTFLAVTGQPQSNISVVQTPVSESVSPGDLVNLQCTVLSEIRTAELRVLWFRAAAGQSFPEIIYTHQNSSSRQCEISSSTHSSVYTFSKNILNQHHTGTYYCAVAACGRIAVGNGTSVHFKASTRSIGTSTISDWSNKDTSTKFPGGPVVIFLGAALGVCVIVISVQAFIIYKMRNSELSSERKQQGPAVESTTRQDHDAENMTYASVHLNGNKLRTGREKREDPDNLIYCNTKAHRPHR